MTRGIEGAEPEVREDVEDRRAGVGCAVGGDSRRGVPVPGDLSTPRDPGDSGLVGGGGACCDQVRGQRPGQGPVLPYPGVRLRVLRVGPVEPGRPSPAWRALPVAQGQAVTDQGVEVPAYGVDVLAECCGHSLGADRVGLGLQELQHPGPGR